MREKLTEEEKSYIKTKILEPITPDVVKVPLFQTIDRAKIMLKTAIERLTFDKDKYTTRILFDQRGTKELVVSIQAKHKDCEEVIAYEQTLKMQ